MEICLQISNTPLFGNELELIKIKGLNHSTDNFRFDFEFFKNCLYYIIINTLNTIFLSIVIGLQSSKLLAIIVKSSDT